MALWDAVCAADEMEVLSLLFHDGDENRPNMDFDPNELGGDGNTALNYAIESDLTSMAQLILKHPQTNPNVPGNLERTPLFLACLLNRPELVSLLLSTDLPDNPIDVNYPDLEGATPLLIACESGNHEIVKLLLDHPEIDPSLADFNGTTPLLSACLFQDLELIRLLLPTLNPSPRGSFLTYQEEDGGRASPLFMACENQNLALLQLLLEEGHFDPNVKKPDGQTPFFCACLTGNVMLVKHLLACTPEVVVDAPVNVQESIKLVGQQKYTDFLTGMGKDWVTAMDIAKEQKQDELWDLITDFTADPLKLHRRLRRELGMAAEQAAHLFGLVVFVSDGLLRVRSLPNQEAEKASRFFDICSQLHLDLQMVICNRAQGLPENFVPFLLREQSFRKIAGWWS